LAKLQSRPSHMRQHRQRATASQRCVGRRTSVASTEASDHWEDSMIDRASPFLKCPRCGLAVRPKISWLMVEYCPRCLAQARIAVRLFSSTLSAAELHPESLAPAVAPRGVTTTIPDRT